jgi:hypothetical protein
MAASGSQLGDARQTYRGGSGRVLVLSSGVGGVFLVSGSVFEHDPVLTAHGGERKQTEVLSLSCWVGQACDAVIEVI